MFKPPITNENKELEERIQDVRWLSQNFSASDLDITDERTKHIMSK